MKQINWGFIGCGEVTEKKSGPAFNSIEGSQVVAVMSRSEQKARSYAERHHIRKWYKDAQSLIDDPDVNAIYISEGLRRIENSAFETEDWTFRSESNKLERVELPASFVYYGEDVFRGKHIGNFFVSEENTAFSSIDGVLYDKNHEQILRYPPLRAYVEEYEIYPGVFQIADYAFYYMRSCEKITLPDTIEANGIGKYAFYQALISHLDMSNAKNVTTISDGMCQGCEFLETVEYPMISKDLTSIETISKYAFTDCVSLPSIYVPYGVKSLELYAFKGCTGATSIDIPDSITSMGMYSIDGCSSITEVRIPYSISTAMFMCVTNCANLKKVILPPFSYTQYEALNSNGDILGTYDKESDALSVAGSDGSVNTVSTKKNSSLYRYSYMIVLISKSMPNRIWTMDYMLVSMMDVFILTMRLSKFLTEKHLVIFLRILQK